MKVQDVEVDSAFPVPVAVPDTSQMCACVICNKRLKCVRFSDYAELASGTSQTHLLPHDSIALLSMFTQSLTRLPLK